jgi:hypothetical protein
VTCDAGTQPNLRGDKCLSCLPGWAGHDGICEKCAGNFIGDATATSCVECSTSSMPDATHTDCTPCPNGLVGDGCGECAEGWYRLRLGKENVSSLPNINGTNSDQWGNCLTCPPGGVCSGGVTGVKTEAGHFVSVDPTVGQARVYKCFDTSCNFRTARPEQGVACANSASGGDGDCCAEGRTGRMCEECSTGYVKIGSECQICHGTNYGGLVVKMSLKLLFAALVCVQFAFTAAEGSYTRTVAVSCAVFSLQTVGLIYSDSFSSYVEKCDCRTPAAPFCSSS